MSELPLSGVRVLEIGGGIAAAFAARWMAGFGAEVVRSEGPAGALEPDEEIYLLAGKQRVSVDDGELRRLALASDIVIEDQRPGTMAARGMGAEELRAVKPALVVVSITPFGQTGPYAQWEATNAVSFGMGGIMSITGEPHRPPMITGGSHAIVLGGLNAFGAAMAAYFGALMQGEGDWIDISLQECAASMLEHHASRTDYMGVDPLMRSGNQGSAVWGIYQLADGFGGVCCLMRQIPSFFRCVGDPELLDPRFMDPTLRLEHNDELFARLSGWFAAKTKSDLLALGPEYKVPFGAVMTPRDLLESPSLIERQFFDHVTTAQGVAAMPGRPWLGTGWRALEYHEAGADTAAVNASWLGGAR